MTAADDGTSLTGHWRITTVDEVADDAIDLVEPAYVELDDDGTGRFAFVAVHGSMDCRAVVRGGRPGVEFTWDGDDDGSPVSGRGWAILTEEDTLDGRVYFHFGDEPSFRAVRAPEAW